jgi:hypothetical protein
LKKVRGDQETQLQSPCRRVFLRFRVSLSTERLHLLLHYDARWQDFNDNFARVYSQHSQCLLVKSKTSVTSCQSFHLQQDQRSRTLQRAAPLKVEIEIL